MARPDQKDKISFEHLNGNLLCAIAIETTGDKLNYSDICQICIMPIDYNVQRMKGYNPFYCDIQPKHKDRIDEETASIGREKLLLISTHGLNWIDASDAIEKWFDKLNLPNGKKIMPLGFQWPRIQPFIYDWLGKNTFEYIFDYRARDIQSISLFLNDYYFCHIENVPYQKNDFAYLCSDSKIIREKGVFADTMTECMALIDVYRNMCIGKIKLEL